MSALDKAFIKAYSQDSPHRRVPCPHFVNSTDKAVAADQRVAAQATARPIRIARTAVPCSMNNAAIAETRAANRSAVARHTFAIFDDNRCGDNGGVGETDLQATKIPFRQPVRPSTPLRASFEVDRVVWPHICEFLSEQLADELAQLAKMFADPHRGRGRVVALAGTSRGAGTTTLCMTLVRQLCEQRSALPASELLLMDADLQNTDLASKLGLAPQVCWAETAAEQTTLNDALIESLADQLVVMSVVNRTNAAGSRIDHRKLAHDLTTLTKHFPTILIDLGTLENARNAGIIAALGGCLDSLLLVHDARQREASQLEDTMNIARQVELEVTGVIENFVVEADS